MPNGDPRHRAIVARKAINFDHAANGGTVKFVMCAWDDCEKSGYELYKVVIETGNIKNGSPSRPLTYIFCCERHRQYWVNASLQAKRGFTDHLYGSLPPGYRNRDGL